VNVALKLVGVTPSTPPLAVTVPAVRTASATVGLSRYVLDTDTTTLKIGRDFAAGFVGSGAKQFAF
jgi:hypothetical protein